MAENFDVKLTKKCYTPDSSYRQNIWIGDYQREYDEFQKYPEAFWDRAARALHRFSQYLKVKKWNYPYAPRFARINPKISNDHQGYSDEEHSFFQIRNRKKKRTKQTLRFTGGGKW
jgi:acetyl-CoA synthetase